ncbi:hypothetical protein AVEN_47657-1 [Araneus ventricosus]|uniref:Uncharacterized protein n=1 Tax=Araneus ventricosus TaxID=182803 RepID=A0A4Y2HYM8_ARAVE|nr:hypothetical protein AVEN_47657-1 [Araneus ventricosus]
MEVSVITQRDFSPNHDSTSFITVSFNHVRLVVSGSLRISTRAESIPRVNLDSSVKCIEAHCCLVQVMCSLVQCKWTILCYGLRGIDTSGLLSSNP